MAYVTLDPYEIWLLNVDGTARHFKVDVAEWKGPEKAAFFAADWKHDIESIEALKATVRGVGGRLYVGIKYEVSFVIAAGTPGVPAGAPGTGGFTFIDVIDETTGLVVERIDPGEIAGLNNGVKWLGVHEKSLVFVGWRRVDQGGDMERFLALASKD